ncbi:Cof-type HAD-IIB family hydrolase [Streptococcus merionis]|uniref:Cof-type HAD-IIB family hydrolase n=1 Tax=Streptococcus merionis TaxID=400065 RepID=UPI003513BD48
MTEIKLLALDLDGTLLNSDKQISLENQKALRAARDRGVKVVLTTGRPLAAIGDFLAELDLIHEDEFAITFNGGLIQCNTGEILDKVTFGYEEVKAIRQLTDQLGLSLDLLDDGDVYALHSAVPTLYPTCNASLNHMPTHFEDLTLDQTFNKAVTCCEADLIDRQLPNIPQEFHDRFEIFKSRNIILEWSPKGVHKANGLASLTQILGLKKEAVMACGDEANDLSMVKWAGYGVAMGNATEELKAVADIVAPMSNDENAVAWAVQTYILKED